MFPRAINRDVPACLVVIAAAATLLTASFSSARAEESEELNAGGSVGNLTEAVRVIEQVYTPSVIETAAASAATDYHFGSAAAGLGQGLHQHHNNQQGPKPKVISSAREGPRTAGYSAGERTRALSRVVKSNFPRR